ncbi:hypothetical protein C4D60_Mb01t04330 [Musa balbisiana]|uniref:SBP-type domain-containing protein n=1 Tax=Musa balbisiana TaxID=52838 RepID=A0A4S8JK08_MUSBA|nr:hypothetical protein C4D60_Mb01t04330 [Musa balbisiana]
MDWNANASLLWDWDNHAPFGGNCKLFGGGASSGSELGNGSSSKSTISASFDSSSKAGKEPEADANPKTHEKNKFLQESGSSLLPAAAAGLEESQIGLKLGKRTYFEDVSAESNSKNHPLSSSLDSASVPTAVLKKSRVSHQSAQSTCCQVEGCNIDLSGAKDYHRKHRVCEMHSKWSKVIVGGQERRSDTTYDDKHQMNLLWNKAPFGHMKPLASTNIEGLPSFKLTQKGSWEKSPKEGGTDAQLHLPNAQLSNGFFTLYPDVDKLLPLKGTATEVLNQGSEASAGALNLGGAPDLRRALSLLSTNSWGSPDPGQTSSIVEFVNASHTSTAQPMVPTINSSSHWIHGQPLTQPPQLLPFTMHRSGNQPQELLLQNTPYRDNLFDPSQIH